MKIQVTLDASKLRNLVKSREYTNKSGEVVKVQEVKFELIPVKDENQKVVFETEKYRLVKTHFAVPVQTREEREAKADTVFIGDGFVTVWIDDKPEQAASNDAGGGEVEAPF